MGFTVSDIANRKNRSKLILFIAILILTGTLIGTIIYYNRKCKALAPENIINNEKISFLNKSKEKIKKLEDAVKKQHGNKCFKNNELDVLIAKKLVDERNVDIRCNDIEYYYSINLTFNFTIVKKTEINELCKHMNKLKKDDEKYKDLQKQIENKFIKNASGEILKILNFYSDASIYLKSFIYLVFYFCNESYNFSQETKNNQIEMENKILKLLDTDEYGKIFKVYMLAENPKNTEHENVITSFLDTNFFGQLGGFFGEFLKCLQDIVAKIDDELEKK